MDKKKIFAMLVVMLSVIASSIAQESLKFYNSGTGYSGYACAIYLDSRRTVSLEEIHYNKISHTSFRAGPVIYKLTDEESFLLWSALDEHDYRRGELYHVTIGHRPIIIAVTVEITGKDTCSFFATYILNR